jgi:hypothetical protein
MRDRLRRTDHAHVELDQSPAGLLEQLQVSGAPIRCGVFFGENQGHHQRRRGEARNAWKSCEIHIRPPVVEGLFDISIVFQRPPLKHKPGSTVFLAGQAQRR